MAEVLTESFCERCGTRYTFESAKPRVKRLTGVKVLSRGLKNFVLSDDSSLDEAMAAARSDTEREVTSQQLDAFHKTFNFCMTCRQYTCANCWNDTEGTCLTCSPHLGHEIMPAPFPDLDPMGMTVALDASDTAASNGSAVANGSNGNGHAAPAYDAAAWPTTDAWPSPDLTEDLPAAEATTDAATDDDEIDVAARMAALTAIGSSQVGTPDPVETIDEPTAAASDPVPAEGVTEPEPDVEPMVAATMAEAEAPVRSDDAAADELAVASPTTVQPTTPAVRDGSPTHDAVAAAAAAQTASLLHRFRPGESLDAELDAYERDHAEPETAESRPAAEAVVADAALDAPEPIAEGTSSIDEGPGAPVAVEALLVSAAGARVDEPAIEVEAEAALEPQAAPIEPGLAASADLEAIVAVEPQAIEAGPEPVTAEAEPITAEAEPVTAEAEPGPVVVEPEPDRAAEVAAAAAAAAALAAARDRPTDVVAQPTWRIVAPDAEPVAPVLAPPAPAAPTTPVAPPVASAQPQWPAAPQWPDQPAAAGLPFLGRPAQPTGGLDSLWAESDREVASAASVPGRPIAPAGVQPCISCGLSLSATARFCRRCGTAQHG